MLSQNTDSGPNTIDVHFKYKSTQIIDTEMQLEATYSQIDSLIKKYAIVVVTPSATSDELKIDPNIDYKRAMKAIKYFTDKYQIKGLVFLIHPVLRKTIYDEDIYRDKKALVNFFPLRLCNE